LRQQLTDPLARNGYALIANSGATGALGLVYWLLMARLYPAADVGHASAVYAAMNLLAGFTALNFNGALTRFIPLSGLKTRSFVLRSYLVSVLASVIVAALFLLTLRWWGPSYSDLDGRLAGLVFAGCVVAWALFTVQDSVLVGLRSAFWVLVENALFGVVKLVLLVLLVTALPHHLGIYASWMLPVFVAVPLVNALIFGRLVPRHATLTQHYEPPSTRQITRFLAGDYAGAMCLLATVSLLPVVVAARTDAESTAYFYIAWAIAGIIDMIGINMGMSLTVEGSFDAAQLAANCRKALRKISWMLLPCALLFGLLAPEVLRLFGPGYAAHGAPVLELLAAATLPRAATELYLGVLRARSKTTLVAVIQAARAVIMLGLAAVLTGYVGTVGAGIAVLVSQGVIAVAIAPGLWRALTGKQARNRSVSTEVSPQ
jgi:O-antigen/teichoic acid export membrane protein